MNKPVVLFLLKNMDEKSLQFIQSLTEPFDQRIIVHSLGEKQEVVLASLLQTVNENQVMLHATKSKALSTGLDYFEKHFKEIHPGVILVSMDQEYSLSDIQTMAVAMDNIPDGLIIGGRENLVNENTKANFIARQFSRITGAKINDFNSGLRGLPGYLISDLLKLPNKQADIWIEMYVQSIKLQCPIVEVPINSNHNHKSPFLLRFLLNSSKMVYIFLRFSFLSMVTAGIDYAIFSIVFFLSKSIFFSMLIARILAGSFQFFFGKKWVFKSRNKLLLELLKYAMLVVVLMVISYLFIQFMVTYFGMNAILSKIIAELSLFLVSFTMQKKIVFASRAKQNEPLPSPRFTKVD